MTNEIKRASFTIVSQTYERNVFHGTCGPVPVMLMWRIHPVEGFIELSVDPKDTPRRTPGEPTTVRRIYEQTPLGGLPFPKPLLAAVIATESNGNWQAERYEPELKDYSIGGAQMLTATALSMNKYAQMPDCPPCSVAQNKSTLPAWRAFLGNPGNAVRLLTEYLLTLDRAWTCYQDPVLLYAAYNAGGLYRGNTQWGVVHTAGSLMRFVAWYNDAVSLE